MPAGLLSDDLDILMTKTDLAEIKLLALDADGVLTDGGVYIFEDGRQFRRFDIKDGLGLKRVMDAGIHVAIISGSAVKAVAHRAQQLGIEDVHLGIQDKQKKLREICRRLGIHVNEVAFVGDDLTDLPVLRHVGLPCAPVDAVKAVKDQAVLITEADGGRGAVREVCEYLLQEKRGGDS